MRPQKLLSAIERLLSIQVLRLQLRHGGFGGLDLGLKGRLLDEVQEIALLDLRALDKHSLLEKAGDPGHERNAAHRLNSANEFVYSNSRMYSSSSGGQNGLGGAGAEQKTECEVGDDVGAGARDGDTGREAAGWQSRARDRGNLVVGNRDRGGQRDVA